MSISHNINKLYENMLQTQNLKIYINITLIYFYVKN